MTLLWTMTMQNVAWPATMVQKPGSRPASLMADSSAMPVMMPGSAIGSANSKVSVCLPGKRLRASANAASVPSTSAAERRRRSHAERQAHRFPHVAAREGDVEPVQREPRRRKVVRAVFGGERVQKNDQHREVQERETRVGRELGPVARDYGACAVPRLDRIERSEPFREREIDRDEHDRHHRERRRQRNVSGQCPAADTPSCR